MGAEAKSANINTSNYHSQPGSLIKKESKFNETINKVGSIMPSYDELKKATPEDAVYTRVGGPKQENLQVNGKGSNFNTQVNSEGKKNWWTGEGFSTDHWLSQASAHDPNAIGAGTILGGKKGGGIGGMIGASIRAFGSNFTGADPSFFSESSAFDNVQQKQENYESAQTITADVELPGSDGNPLYPVQKSEKYKQSFRDSFAENRELRNRTFKWIGEDDIEREYSTQLKGETDDDWLNFLENTMEGEAASDIITNNSDTAFT
tara:strand:- start:7661 stop:8449 length:789 start_codon:yes stop_codon:yes gene_type:complete